MRPFDALLVDVAGTLLAPAEPVASTYARIAAEHGVGVDPAAVKVRFAESFAAPWEGLRYPGDGRPFWRRVVAAAVGSDDDALFEALYGHFAATDAWRIAPDALAVFDQLRADGVRVALVSDFDARLRPLLVAMGVLSRVDHAAISCEVGAEKPDPTIFHAACAAVGVAPSRALHVGDDAERDVQGARAAGCRALWWGVDLRDFAALVSGSSR